MSQTEKNKYELSMGLYTYSCICEGYESLIDQRLAVVDNETIDINLSKKDIYGIRRLINTSTSEWDRILSNQGLTAGTVSGKSSDSIAITSANINNYFTLSGGNPTWTGNSAKYTFTNKNYSTYDLIAKEDLLNVVITFTIYLGTDNYTLGRLYLYCGNTVLFSEGSQIHYSGQTKVFKGQILKGQRIHMYGIHTKSSGGSVSLVGSFSTRTPDYSTYKNDFDNIYPWSDIRTCDLLPDGSVAKYYDEPDFSYTNPTGYIMTEFPKFYYGRKQENDYEYIYICQNKDEKAPLESKKFYLSRYPITGSTDSIKCASGATSIKNISLDTARELTKAIGANWSQLNIFNFSMLQILYLIEYADYNSQKILGPGNSSSSSILDTGTMDIVGMKSGSLAGDGIHGVIYRGIENPFGNLSQWCDGINFNESQAWVNKDISTYQSNIFTSPYTKLSYKCPDTANYIKEVGYDPDFPMIILPLVNEATDSTYITDWGYANSGQTSLKIGGGNTLGNYDGMFYCTWYDPSTNSTTNAGVRLLYIPPEE